MKKKESKPTCFFEKFAATYFACGMYLVVLFMVSAFSGFAQIIDDFFHLEDLHLFKITMIIEIVTLAGFGVMALYAEKVDGYFKNVDHKKILEKQIEKINAFLDSPTYENIKILGLKEKISFDLCLADENPSEMKIPIVASMKPDFLPHQLTEIKQAVEKKQNELLSEFNKINSPKKPLLISLFLNKQKYATLAL